MKGDPCKMFDVSELREPSLTVVMMCTFGFVGGVASHLVHCLLEVGDDVLGILDAYG